MAISPNSGLIVYDSRMVYTAGLSGSRLDCQPNIRGINPILERALMFFSPRCFVRSSHVCGRYAVAFQFLAVAALSLSAMIAADTASAEDWAKLWDTYTLPQAVEGPGMASVNGKIYISGGITGTNTFSNVVNVYDAASNTWLPSMTLPNVGSAQNVAAVAGNKVLFAAESATNKTVDIYDTSTNTWSTSQLSTPRDYIGHVSVGDSAYFLGGGGVGNVMDIYNATTNTWSSTTIPHAGPIWNNAVAVDGKIVIGCGATGGSWGDVYDTTTGVWSSTYLPGKTANGGSAGAVVGNKVVFGGGSAQGYPSGDVNIYDASTNTWSTPTTGLSEPRYWLAAGAGRTKVLFAGGSTGGTGVTNKVDIYDTATGNWSSSTLSQARWWPAAASVDNKILFAGGAKGDGTFSNVVDIYTEQHYGTITSTKVFDLVDNTIVDGLMQLNAGASVNLGTYSLTAGSMSGTGAVHLGSSTLTVGSDNSVSTTYSGGMTGNGAITKTGTGTLVLAGDNSHTGGTNVNQGTVQLGAHERLANTGALNVNGGTFDLNGYDETVGAVTLASGAITGSGTLTGSSYNVQSGTINANLAGTAALQKTGSGTVVMSAATSYSGGTTISGGTLQMGTANALPTAGIVTIADGAKLDLHDFDTTVSGVDTSGPANTGQIDLGDATLTVHKNGGSSNLGANITGSGSVHKSGTATLYAFGSNTYTGATLIEGGTLNCTSGSALPTTTDVTISNGAKLAILNQPATIKSLNGSGELALTSGSLTVGSGDFAGQVSGSQSLIVNGTGALTLTGDNTGSGYSGDVSVAKGSLLISNGGQFTNKDGNIGSLSGLSGNASVVGVGSAWNNTGSLYVGGDGSASRGTGLLTVESGGAVSVANTLKIWGTGTTTVNTGGTVTVTGTLATRSGGRVNLSGGTINTGTLDNAGTFNWTAGTLNLTNSGLTVDPGANPFGGSLAIGTGKTLGTRGSLVVGLDGQATMNISGGGIVSSDSAVIGKNLGATGAVTVNGAATRWNTSGGIAVGSGGVGRLYVQAGASVTDAGATLGSGSGSSGYAYVDGVGSTWSSAGPVVVGQGTPANLYSDGYGYVYITNGAAVSASSMRIGEGCVFQYWDASSNSYHTGYSRGEGAVRVSGRGSRLTVAQSLVLAPYINGYGVGSGQLTIDSEGLVDIGSTLELYNGGAIVNGGTLRLRSLSNPYGQLYFNYGTLNFTDSLNSSSLSGVVGDDLHPISVGKHLQVNGTTTLTEGSEFVIDGGTFSTGALVNPVWLNFKSGTFNLTNSDLTIGNSGLLGAMLSLQTGKAVGVTRNTSIASGGKLDMQGGTFSSGALANQGTIGGTGQINAPLTNAASGKVRALTGECLAFTAGTHLNQGQIQLYGGTIEFNGVLNNATGGLITGNGNLIANSGLTNSGTMAFSSTANIDGDVTNNANGKIISAGGTTTFWDDVVNQGEIRTSSGSFSVFYGSLSGSGSFTGPGTVLIEGDLKPGNSPTISSFGGNLTFSSGSTLEIELAGILANSPTEFDQLHVAGTLSLGGALNVVLLDGFAPRAGNTFDIMDFGTLVGQFDTINLPTLGNGLSWDTSSLYTQGSIGVVPEPSVFVLLLVGSGCLVVRAWRRRS